MSEEDCEAICLYLHSGFTFQHAITFIQTKRNKRCVHQLLKKLEDGESVDQIMIDLCPKKYRKLLPALLNLLPFSKALQLSVTLLHDQESFKRQTLSEVVYPLFLFIGTWCGVAIFTYFCFPILLSLMSGFAMKNTGLLIIHQLMKLLCIVVLCFVLFLLCCSACLMCKSTKLWAYLTLCKLVKGNLIQQYHSNLFARFYVQCMKSGCKTKETLKLLHHIQAYPFCQYFSQSIETQLTAGIAFHQAITHIPIEPRLIQVLQIAMTSSTLESYLEGYLVMSHEKMKKHIRRITKGFQLVSYSSIAFIVIVVYQVLILPLSLMAEL